MPPTPPRDDAPAREPEAPRRVRVTSPRREARRRGAQRPAAQELEEQTGLGEVYLSALLRAQLRLSVAILLGISLVVLGLPALFILLPAAQGWQVGPIPLAWLAIGVLIYPVVFLAARIYVAQAERIEREFSDLMSQQ
jgi:hypothetical protein